MLLGHQVVFRPRKGKPLLSFRIFFLDDEDSLSTVRSSYGSFVLRVVYCSSFEYFFVGSRFTSSLIVVDVLRVLLSLQTLLLGF